MSKREAAKRSFRLKLSETTLKHNVKADDPKATTEEKAP